MSEAAFTDAGCRNCGADDTATYCATCGQRQVERLSLRHLRTLASERLFDADQGLLHTLWHVYRHPGRVERAYVLGQRRRYLNPFSFFLLAATAQLFGLWVNSDVMMAMINAQATPEVQEALAELGAPNPATWLGERYLMLLQNAYTWMAALAFILPLAAMLRLLLRRRGVNIAETLVVATYSVAAIMLLTGIVGLATMRLSPTLHGLVSPLLYLLWGALVTRRVFGPGAWPTAAGLLAMLVAAVSFFACIIIGNTLVARPGLLPF